MKRKQLLFLASFVVLLIGAILFKPNQENKYHPRNPVAAVSGYYGAAEYYTMMKANPETGLVDGDLIKTIEESALAFNAEKNGEALNLTWEEVGPDNIGGRTRAILAISDDLIFAGSVSGGLFKSTNKGNTWERVPGFDKNYAISTMAVLGNGHIYIGTGSTHELVGGFGGSGSIGGGLFVSTDNGKTWNYAKDGDGNDIKPSSLNLSAEYAFIDRIVADPNSDNKLWVAYNKALKPYTEGSGFGSVPSGLPNARCEDVDISSDGSVIAASIGNSGNSNGYVSTDGGASFTKVSGSGTDQIPSNLVRLEFAVSPDDENYIYAAIAIDGRIGKFDGVFSSRDKGATWERIWTVTDNSNPDPGEQAFYDMAISVVPGDKDAVIVGALTIWSAGTLTVPLQRSFPGSFFRPGSDLNPLNVHADVHVFEWADDGTLYIGTDGGLARSTDYAETFIDINRFYNVTQFYGVGYSANDKVIGGSQDNSTQYVTKDRTTVNESYTVGFGDGFDCEISNLEPEGNVIFATFQFNSLLRSSDAGFQVEFFGAEMVGETGPFHSQIRLWETKEDFNNPNRIKFTNNSGDVIPAGTEIEYMSATLDVPLKETLTEDLAPNDTILFKDPVSSLFSVGYSGTSGVWVTRDALSFLKTPEFAKVINSVSGTVSAQEWSKTDGNHLFIGTTSGNIYRISGFADAYTVNEMSVDSAEYALTTKTIYSGSAPILDIAVDPNDDDHLIAARAGFGGGSKVIESFNAASVPNPSFNSIWFTDGPMVGLPAYSCVIDASDPNVILVGTEFGIYSTVNGGADWGYEGEDPLGAYPIFDIRQQWRSPNDVENSGFIYVGTHGRGAMQSASLQKTGINEVTEQENNELVTNLLIAPNPMSDFGKLEFSSETEGLVTMDIYSLSGQRVKSLRFAMNLGENSYKFDVSDLRYGTYVIQLRKDSKVTTKKFVIIR